MFVLGGQLASSNQTADDVWFYSLRLETWLRMPVVAGSFGKVLAATYRPDDRGLYVLDAVAGGWGTTRRLVRVDVGTSKVEMLGAWPKKSSLDLLYLSNAPQGDLLVSASSAKEHRWTALRVRVGASGARRRSSRQVTARVSLTLVPTLTDRGLTVPVKCDPPEAAHGAGSHGEGHHDDDGDDAVCVGVRNLFVPASDHHDAPQPSDGDDL